MFEDPPAEYDPDGPSFDERPAEHRRLFAEVRLRELAAALGGEIKPSQDGKKLQLVGDRAGRRFRFVVRLGDGEMFLIVDVNNALGYLELTRFSDPDPGEARPDYAPAEKNRIAPEVYVAAEGGEERRRMLRILDALPRDVIGGLAAAMREHFFRPTMRQGRGGIRCEFTADVQDHWEDPEAWEGVTLVDVVGEAVERVARLAEAVETARADHVLSELATTCGYCQTFVRLTAALKCPNCGASVSSSS